jgi:putative cell wall-binding protein
VNDASYADALAAGPLAVALDAPLLLTPADRLDTGCGAFAARAGDTVYLVGGPAALSPKVESGLRDLGFTPERIAGADRYATAVAVAKAADQLRPDGASQDLFLASGTDFADALSAGVPAGAARGSVLLTAGSRMTPATAAYLSSRPGATVYAVGGPAAAAADLPVSRELVGPNRYETATMVAERFFPQPSSVAFASGVRFPDALSAAAYGGQVGLPVLLVGPDGVPNAVFDWMRAHRSTVRGSVLVGGEEAVNRLVFDVLTSRLTPPV